MRRAARWALHQGSAADDEHEGDVDDEMRRNLAYGRASSVLPYLLQDGYGRAAPPRNTPSPCWRTADCGQRSCLALADACGRSWTSHPDASCSTATRSSSPPTSHCATRGSPAAWSGTSARPGTRRRRASRCTPAASSCPDGTPMLRMSEFERIREVVYQVDVWLSEGSPVLLVHVRITNPGAAEVPMYWWTNIAVPQCPDVRVLAPADARGTSTTTEGCAGCRCRTTRVSTGRTRRARATPLTTSSPSTTTSGDGWLPWTPRAAGSSRRRPAVCAAASCSCGARAPVESTGRTGSPAPPVSTSRSRPAWRGPSWSTCRCPGTRRGRGSRRSAARGRNEGGALR